AQQRQVEMGIGILGVQAQRAVITVLGLVQPPFFVVQVAEIEMRQRIRRIRLDGTRVEPLRLAKPPHPVMNRAQVYPSPGSMRVEVDRFLIRRDRLLDGRAPLLQFQPALEPAFRLPLQAGAIKRRLGWKRFHIAALRRFEIEQDLPADRLQALARHLHRQPPSFRHEFDLGKRILQAGYLPLQGSDGKPDFLRRDAVFAEFDESSQTDQILERKNLGVAHEILPLPPPELLFGDTQHPADVLARIILLGHVLLQARILTWYGPREHTRMGSRSSRMHAFVQVSTAPLAALAAAPGRNRQCPAETFTVSSDSALLKLGQR